MDTKYFQQAMRDAGAVDFLALTTLQQRQIILDAQFLKQEAAKAEITSAP